jgi:DNA-binding PadR family transcriptional regulator
MYDAQSNCSDPLEQHKSEHCALAVLQMLAREPSYANNEEIVSRHFDRLGLTCSHAQIRECLRMLEQAGLIDISMVEKLTVIRLTEKGDEVGKGLIVVEGVLRPSVECPY